MMHSTLRALVIIIGLAAIPYQSIAAKDELIFALDLIRHGDRTATHDIPNAAHTWSEGKGQLTALGMQQEYQLGLKFNQRYTIDNTLLSPHYQANTIYIRSTDYDRTIMSAQSVLLGLYPLGTGPTLPDSKTPALPGNFQPIPIHTMPTAEDSAFLIDITEASALLSQYVFTRDDWQAKSLELEPNYNRWSQITGLPIEQMFDLISLGDSLHTYLAHNIRLPEGLTKEEAQYIVASGDWIYATLFKPQEIGDAVGKDALKKIIGYIQEAVEHKNNTKFILLSAHDVTILGVMSALHTPLDLSPSYASDLNFSVYKSEFDQYFVKITFNDKPVNIPGCKGNICTLHQFTRSIN